MTVSDIRVFQSSVLLCDELSHPANDTLAANKIRVPIKDILE
jgi:hypothetical protein